MSPGTRLAREGVSLLTVLAFATLLAGLTLVGSWLLRFRWFESLFRHPTEIVLFPVWLVAFSLAFVVVAIPLFWLALALAPGLERRPVPLLATLLGALALAYPLVVWLWLEGSGGALILVPAALVLVVPRWIADRLQRRSAARQERLTGARVA